MSPKTREKPKGAEAPQADVPLPDREWISKWSAVAKTGMPTPDEWAGMITNILWIAQLEKMGFGNPRLPGGMTASSGSLQFILKLLMPDQAGVNDEVRQARLNLMTSGAFTPLIRLHSAINDLANGRVSSLFQPKKKRERGGRPGKGNVDDFYQAMAARALGELQRAREKQNRAAQRVANAYNAGTKINGGGIRPVTFETVKNWKDRLSRGRPGPGASEIAIRHFREPLPKQWGDSPAAKAETLLRALRSRLWLID